MNDFAKSSDVTNATPSSSPSSSLMQLLLAKYQLLHHIEIHTTRSDSYESRNLQSTTSTSLSSLTVTTHNTNRREANRTEQNRTESSPITRDNCMHSTATALHALTREQFISAEPSSSIRHPTPESPLPSSSLRPPPRCLRRCPRLSAAIPNQCACP